MRDESGKLLLSFRDAYDKMYSLENLKNVVTGKWVKFLRKSVTV